MNYIKALQKSQTICVFKTFFFICTFIIDRPLLNRGTGIGIATDCNTGAAVRETLW